MNGLIKEKSKGWAAPYQVLLIEDDPAHAKLVERIFEGDKFRLTQASNGYQALELIRDHAFDVVLVDKYIPGMDGHEVCYRIRHELNDQLLQVIVITSSDDRDEVVRSLEAGANDFIRKPFVRDELRARVEAAANHKRVTDQLDSVEAMLFSLAQMVEARDEHTGNHCARLSHMAVVFGKELGLSEEEQLALYRGAMLHDLGKVGVPDRILLKGGALDDEEWRLMRRHPLIGARLCKGLKSLSLTVPIIQHHHERWDGSGYPYGLERDEIPLLARIFQIVDIYDALMSERPYKPSWSRDQVLEALEDEAAKGWRDPELTAAFCRLARSRPESLELPGGNLNATMGSRGMQDVYLAEATAWGRH